MHALTTVVTESRSTSWQCSLGWSHTNNIFGAEPAAVNPVTGL